MRTVLLIMLSCGALLAGCGGGGGGDSNAGTGGTPGGGDTAGTLPASAQASPAALMSYAFALPAADSSVPLDLDGTTMPTSDSDDPVTW